MELRNTFTVPADPDEAFAALLDLGRVAPCMPGAELTDQDGDTYHGRLKLRIGPITAKYAGTVSIEHADAEARRARLGASGTEIGGQGGASATVVATVQPDGDRGSEVEVVTELDIRGKAAQFGRGAMGEVTQRVLDQFASNLEATFLTTSPDESAGSDSTDRPASPSGPSAPTVAGQDADLDVLRVLAGPAITRAAPALVAFLVGLLLGRLGRRRPADPAPMAWCPPPWWGTDLHTSPRPTHGPQG